VFDQGFRFAREWMRSRRQQMGFTQADIAEKLGVGQTAVSQWESGRVAPSMRNLMFLAGVLECNPTDLVEPDVDEPATAAVG
jgi:transcriptional regulator with XRE-family HTH domain